MKINNTLQTLKIGLLLLSPAAIFCVFNYHNMPLKFSMLLGIIVFPYVVNLQNKPANYRYALLSGLAAIALLFIRTNSLYYFSAIFLLLFVLDKWISKINHLPILLTIAISPIINTMVYIWSFPIRLKLSEWAGATLKMVGFNIEVNGNVLLLDGNTFAVDPACIGLKLITTSLVLSIVLFAYFEKKHQKIIGFWQAIPLLTLVLIATIFANFIRLLTLIVFHILPENPLHDAVGMFSLAVYVLLPMYFIIRFYFKKQVKTPIISSSPQQVSSLVNYVIYVILIGLLIWNGRQFLHSPIENKNAIEHIELANFKKTITPHGVLKLQNDSALIYIKPPVKFYQGSHDPRFCWQGSGYDFSEVEITNIGKKQVYTALLTKEDDKIYTAWWYQSPNTQTTNEWTWRTKNLSQQEAFYMLNVSCTDRSSLKKWVNIWEKEKLFEN